MRLMLLVTRDLCRVEPLHWLGQVAAEGLVDAIQVREKDLTTIDLVDWTRQVLRVAGSIPVLVNDRVDVALMASAAGAHLGQQDLPLTDARGIADGRLTLGVSTHDQEQLLAAFAGGAAYAGFGPLWPSATRGNDTGLGAAAWAAAAASVEIPVLAIGGVTAERIGELAAAADRSTTVRVAVSAAICSAPDPVDAARRLRSALDAS